MIVCNIKVLKYLKSHRHSLSTTSRRVQNELTKILTAQAIIPIFTAFLPMAFHLLSVFIDWDFVLISFICGILYSWIPTGNAICVLFFVTAYRKKVKQLLLRMKSNLPRITLVSNTVPTGIQ